MKKLKIAVAGLCQEIVFLVTKYSRNGNLAVMAYNAKTMSPFVNVTVNLEDLMTGYAYINANTVLNLPENLKKAGIAEPTGATKIYGYVEYPLYKFNLDALSEYACPESDYEFKPERKMSDNDFKNLIMNYLGDENTVIYPFEVDDRKIVVEYVEDSDYLWGDFNHYVGNSYKEIFDKYFKEPILENVDFYEELLSPKVSEYLCSQLSDYDKSVTAQYIRYYSNWCKEHDFGEPECFEEWYTNEHREGL